MRRLKIKETIARAAMMLLMLLTTASAWAFKTETPVTYTVSYISYNHQITIGGGTNTSWTASSIGVDYYWAANVSHALANGMSVKTSADVKCNVGFMTTASTTFTFTTSGNTAISGVTFMGGSVTATSSEPGTTFTVTLAQGSTFTGFVVTYGNISGSCGTSATWSLAKQSGQYTALTIGGSGALTISGSDAPWGTDLTSVTIGSNITSIGNYAFNGCTALTRVNVQKTNGLVTLSSSAFNGCSALQHIVVPTPAIAVGYQTAANWSTHAAKLRVALGSYLFAATDEGGTAAYAITSETDLRNLSAVVNAGGGNAVKNLTFRQTANITLNGTFTPMGYNTDNSWTKGTYDGGGYTISGLNVNYYIDQYAWHGFFGYVNEGTVKNVVLINPSFRDYQGAALICKLDAGTAMNCYAYGTGDLIEVQLGNPTVTNVGRARKVTLGSGVTVSPAATDIANGFVYNSESYYREGLTLTLGATATTGYTAVFSANGTVIDGETYTVNSTDGDVTVSVEWTENVLTLLNNDSAQPEGSKNADIIAAAEASGKTYNRVTLQGRTLYKDGEWNTLCLPFSMTAAQIAASPLAGATIKEMATTSNLDANGVLTLNFSTVTAIEAGKPYIIKWTTTGDNIVNPVFSNVTISSTTPESVTSTDGKVTFVGQYSPFSIVESGATGSDQGNKNEILLMTKGNKIGYSKNPRTLNCFRCHFYVPTNGGQQAHSIEVDFGEGEATSVASMEDGRSKMEDVYYTLDGRKLEGKPTAKGMYIVNGRKVIIK